MNIGHDHGAASGVRKVKRLLQVAFHVDISLVQTLCGGYMSRKHLPSIDIQFSSIHYKFNSSSASRVVDPHFADQPAVSENSCSRWTSS